MATSTAAKAATHKGHGQLAIVRLDLLRANPLNPRTRKPDDEAFEELTQSIRENGILQPLLVTPDGLIIAGHRRWLAARKAGLVDAPVIARELNEQEQIAAMLVENIQREGLTPLEMAQAYRELHDRGVSIEGIAERVGFGKQSVAQYLDILKLPDELRKAIDERRLGLGAVRQLLRLPTKTAQLRIGQKAIEGDWLLQEIETAVRRELAAVATPAVSQPHPVSMPSKERPELPLTPISSIAEERVPPTRSPQTPPKVAQRSTDLLLELTRIVRSTPAIVLDPSFQSWTKEFAAAVKAAQDGR